GPGLDLDADQAQRRTAVDLRDYVIARLSGVDVRMAPAAVADQVAAVGREVFGGRPFLLARLVTDQLRASPVDTSEDGGQRRVAAPMEDAFAAAPARTAPPTHRPPTAGPDHVVLARTLLAALAWGYGAGLPEQEWLVIANATAQPPVEFCLEDLLWVLDQ